MLLRQGFARRQSALHSEEGGEVFGLSTLPEERRRGRAMPCPSAQTQKIATFARTWPKFWQLAIARLIQLFPHDVRRPIPRLVVDTDHQLADQPDADELNAQNEQQHAQQQQRPIR